MRRTGGGMSPLLGKEFSELAREEFSGVVAVKGADNAYGTRRVLVGEGRKGSDELPHVRRSFRL
eukprot:2703685-Pleurochrysis_carterae.AAC.1